MLRRITIVSTVVTGLVFALGSSAQEKKYDMASIKYAGLKNEVAKYRGKVLVVDFWTSG